MPVPKKDALVGNQRELVLRKIKVTDVALNPNPGVSKFDSEKLDKKYLFTLTAGSIVMKVPSTETVKPKDWVNCFKFNDAGYIQYKRWSDIILTLCVLKYTAKGEVIKTPFDVNELIGFEFEAQLIELEGKEPFVDWISAFQAAGVEIPTPAKEESKEEPKADLSYFEKTVGTEGEAEPSLPF